MKLYITGPVGSGKPPWPGSSRKKPGSPASTWTRWPMSRTRTVPAATGNGRRKSGTQCSVPFWNRRTIS